MIDKLAAVCDHYHKIFDGRYIAAEVAMGVARMTEAGWATNLVPIVVSAVEPTALYLRSQRRVTVLNGDR